ncbi:MAG: LEPR-XLL domain-containing protein, partial [Myxococcota bacterium]|nr:LEPR-XLL domain-containing protein [Myxococcota bacterium]
MSKPKRAQREGRSQGETKARLEIESLEQRILLSASWVDGATGEAIEGPTAGDDAFHGSEADDVARSLEGDDQLFGKGGDDVLEGGPGNDALAGGEGVDVASYENAPAGVSVDLTLSGPQDTGGAGTDSLDSIEGVRGSSHDDTFRFSRPEAGRSYSVDGGGGTNTIDLGQVRRADAHFGDGSLQVELGGGESFRIDHENVRTVTFADATVNFVVWDGNGPSADASDPANWDTDALPGPDDVLVFDASSPGAAELGGSFPDTIGGLQLGEGYRGSIRLSEPLGVTGDVVIASGRLDLDGETLSVSGNLERTGAGRLDAGGSALRFEGGGEQSVVLGGAALHDVEVDKPGGTLELADALRVTGSWTTVAGAVDASAATVEFQGDGNTIDASGARFGDVVLDGYRFTLGSELDVDGDLTIERLSRLDGAELRVAGDVTTLDASVGGSSTVVLDGSSQVVGARGGTGELHDLRIESTGTVTVQDHLQISGNLHLASGALDASGATVEFQGDGNTIDASEASFGDVVLDGYRFTLGSELDVDGDLTIERLSRLDGAELRVAGDVTTLDASVGGSSTVVLDGGSQVVGARGGTGELHDLRIESTGTVTVQDHLQISGNLHLASGALDA